MKTFLEFAVVAIPLTAAVGAILFFCRKRIHQQMEDIAKAAKAGAFKRPVRFRPLPTLPADRHRAPIAEPDAEAGVTTQAA